MCSFIRRPYLTILIVFGFLNARSQTSRCDSIQWSFDVNQFAIDGDNLLADFADKGWTSDFFQNNEIDVTIYGATDCPGSLAYNTTLAGYRALYLRNYFEVSEFPHLTIANAYALPERNCVKPGQGYNRADRITALKVCWSGEMSAAQEYVSARSVSAEQENKPVIEKTEIAEQPEIPAEKETEVAEEKPIETAVVVDSTAAIEIAINMVDSLPTPHEENLAETAVLEEAKDSLAAIPAEPTSIEPSTPDSINVLMADTLYMLPTQPKKILDAITTPELHKGDEVIAQGLNFYPGSHRTLPEAKPVLRNLLTVLQENPSLRVEIQGHVCCASKPNEDGLDDETGDFKLSWNRAQYVRDYLVQNGIAADRVTYRGFAMTRPLVYPENTIQDQIKNRRVEILITSE
jgi:outer membrane protein OmpA-like peptidoglycan-associated protein